MHNDNNDLIEKLMISVNECLYTHTCDAHI